MPGSRKKGEERSRYYRTIARCFFDHRGAPFFLSSKDLDVVAKWEKSEIPLSVVLEGMRHSFSRAKKRPRRGLKIHSLAFCNPGVLEAYEMYKDRNVGRQKVLLDEDNRKKRMKNEIRSFLASIPADAGYVKDLYSRALKEAARRETDEERLEQLEEEIEELLLANASSEETEKIRKEILEEYRGLDDEEHARILRIKLIKHLRDRFRLPHISLFYY